MWAVAVRRPRRVRIRRFRRHRIESSGTSRPTRAGFLYLAIILDVLSRRIFGWAMANQQRTERGVEVLEMAVVQRQPKPLTTGYV